MPSNVYDAVLDAFTLKQIKSTNFQANVETASARAAGATAASAIYVVKGEPRCSFTSADLGGVIAGTSMTAGAAVSSGTVTIPWNKRTTTGFAGSLSHLTLSATDGLILPKSFSGRQSDPAGAECEVEFIATSTDGETAPFAVNVNQTLAAAAFNAVWEFGPCSINGTQVDNVISSQVNTGLEAQLVLHDGDHYPQLVFLESEKIEPSITLTFADITELNTHGPLFAAMTATAVHYRKRADGGVTVSDATAQHCRFSFAAGVTSVDTVQGSFGETGEVSVVIKGKSLTASATSAVSL